MGFFPMSTASKYRKRRREQIELEERKTIFLLEDTKSSAEMSEHIWWPVVLLDSNLFQITLGRKKA